ncbi:hypothetical protein D3C86_1531440 [compost metagenome]
MITEHKVEMLLVIIQKLNNLLRLFAFVNPVSDQDDLGHPQLIRHNQLARINFVPMIEQQSFEIIHTFMNVANNDVLLILRENGRQVSIQILDNYMVIRIRLAFFNQVKVLSTNFMDFIIVLASERPKDILS